MIRRLETPHTLNPFVTGSDGIRELLESQLADPAQNDANSIFRARAVDLMGVIVPLLVWLRDNRGVALDIDVVRGAFDLRWIWNVAMANKAGLRDAVSGQVLDIDVSQMPHDFLRPVRAYLGGLPGYDPDLPLDKQKSDEPSRQHGYAQFYVSLALSQLVSASAPFSTLRFATPVRQ